MNFQRIRHREEPEINLIPMIDVLLVILIFLLVSTSYAKFAQLEINLPQATGAPANPDANKQIAVAVDASELYSVNNQAVEFHDVQGFAQALHSAAGGEKDPTIIISADAKAPHQAVINVMEAARLAGFARIAFTTQSAEQ